MGNLNDFLDQIICLTIAPAFFTGGVYYLLAKLVVIYGEKYSLLKPMQYSIIFITCDVISLVVQAIGGAMAATALKKSQSTVAGTHIMVAGIAFQVLSMAIFLFFFGWFMYRVWQTRKVNPDEFNPKYKQLRERAIFKLFPIAITICVLFIFVRCVYRVVELSEGWTGFLMTHETYFLVLDGLMVLLGALSLTIVHPGFAFGKQRIPIQGVHRCYQKSQEDLNRDFEETVFRYTEESVKTEG